MANFLSNALGSDGIAKMAGEKVANGGSDWNRHRPSPAWAGCVHTFTLSHSSLSVNWTNLSSCGINPRHHGNSQNSGLHLYRYEEEEEEEQEEQVVLTHVSARSNKTRKDKEGETGWSTQKSCERKREQSECLGQNKKEDEKKKKQKGGGGVFSFGHEEKDEDKGGFFSKIFKKGEDDDEKGGQKKSGFAGLFTEGGEGGQGGGGGVAMSDGGFYSNEGGDTTSGGLVPGGGRGGGNGDLLDDLFDVAEETSAGK
ncbi:keratin, type I cytoskeletal 9-like [Mugil cephalus]|uniref:keratin, type I cytoskeletal 9-like n=1 Tax=Mugil cephalus TaxID=48193 RepID=UPI001FB6906F|nr:keratin, type I cytoskeletal 9-like [Mugil cephalus]